MIGDAPVMTRQLCENRQNPKIYHALKTIMKDEDIWVNMGRVGYFRPTKGQFLFVWFFFNAQFRKNTRINTKNQKTSQKTGKQRYKIRRK